MSDAGVEVVGEVLDYRGQRAAVGMHEVVASSRANAGEAASSRRARTKTPRRSN
jgi:hypothetical protein